ncbi:hypothetical protein BDV96DRAFT_578130 [Lophiotrema nucula]|uniref:F-box domain-containing protein n=1 Tax=Lophiotrema nucula TaxID=690887 RepID=A0A6A5Z3I0_9PLEO|nr:hypothetical protein BDV96DRAFT_578130 [Lophiotrema nucula]
MPKTRTKRKVPPQAAPPPSKGLQRGRASKKKAEAIGGQAGLSRLDALPDELLLNVLGHLERPEPFARPMYTRHDVLRAFRSLSLTNRHLNALALDFLYSSVDSDFYPHRRKLVQTLVANPELARRVKIIRWDEQWGCYSRTAPYKPTSRDTRLLRHSLKQLDIPDRARWVEAYSSGRSEELLRVALLHTPNVRELHLGHDSFYRSTDNPYKSTCVPLLLNAVNGKPIGLSPNYEHLHTLSLRVTGMHYRDYSTVFDLASIKNLALVAMDDTNDFGTVDLHGPSGVTHLSLLESYVDSANLAVLIRRCRELQGFSFSFDPEQVFAITHDNEPLAHFVWPQVRAALLRHKDSLTEIDIDDHSYEGDATRDPLPIGSFKEFTKLASLGVPFEVLRAKDGTEEPTELAAILPGSLRRLDLTVFEEEEDTHDCYYSIAPLFRPLDPPLGSLQHINIRAHRIEHLGCLRFRELYGVSRHSEVKLTVERESEHYEDFDDPEFDTESEFDEYDSELDWDHPFYDDYLDEDELEDEMMDYLYDEMLGGHYHMHLFGGVVNPLLQAPPPPLAFDPGHHLGVHPPGDLDD